MVSPLPVYYIGLDGGLVGDDARRLVEKPGCESYSMLLRLNNAQLFVVIKRMARSSSAAVWPLLAW
jgi:hypothetical protein